MRRFILSAGCVAALMAGRMMAQDDPAAKGKDVFEQCGVCHNTDTDEKKIGPSLKGLFKREKLKNGKKVTDENVLALINAGGGGMPAYADTLSDEEKEERAGVFEDAVIEANAVRRPLPSKRLAGVLA